MTIRGVEFLLILRRTGKDTDTVRRFCHVGDNLRLLGASSRSQNLGRAAWMKQAKQRDPTLAADLETTTEEKKGS